MTESSRPTSLAEARRRAAAMFDPELMKRGLAVRLRPTDVVITPFGKSGTTWVQQIVHTLRTRGDMDFDDISRVVPWIETSAALGLNLDAEQRAHPRAFKSHLGWDKVPRGGRYIVVLRDPGDALVSAFRFQEGWFFEPGSVAIEEFAADYLASRHYHRHLLSWWPRRNDEDVLMLAYEHMLVDPDPEIERIAAFVGIELDEELFAITRKHTSIEFMLAHKNRFDDALMRALSEAKAGLPPGSDSAKVRAGRAGSKVELGPELIERLDAVWREEVTAAHGYESYAELIADL